MTGYEQLMAMLQAERAQPQYRRNEFGVPVELLSAGMEGYVDPASINHAANDALFVTPSARRSMVAGRLIRAAEDEARERGATRFAWHCRAGTALAETLRAHGYSTVDEVVARAL